MADERFDVDRLDEEDPFEIDDQAAHLFKHPHLGIGDIDDVWSSDPLFYPAKPAGALAHVCRRVRPRPGRAACTSRSRNPRRCRPIGCYEAAPALGSQCRRDR